MKIHNMLFALKVLMFNRAIATGEEYSHKHALPDVIGRVIKPVFRSLADPNLLSTW
jgi:hypothetical protein